MVPLESPVNKWPCKWNLMFVSFRHRYYSWDCVAQSPITSGVNGKGWEVCFLCLVSNEDVERMYTEMEFKMDRNHTGASDSLSDWCALWSVVRRYSYCVSARLYRLPCVPASAFLCVILSGPPHPSTEAHVRSPSSGSHPWGGITARASTRTAQLSLLWTGRIYWIPERAFSPSSALSAACLETGLHYRWAPGSHRTLTALKLPPVDTHKYSTCIDTNREPALVWGPHSSRHENSADLVLSTSVIPCLVLLFGLFFLTFFPYHI